MQLEIYNQSGHDLHVAVHHAGCGSPIIRDALFQCWQTNVAHGQSAVYVPGDFVTNFDKISAIFGGAVAVAGGIALFVASDGVGAPVAAEAIEAGGAAAAEAAADLAADGDVELTALEEEQVAQSAAPERAEEVARQAGVDAAKLRKWVKFGATATTSVYAIGAAFSGASGGFNVYITPTTQAKDVFGNPTQMWRAEGVVVSAGRRKYVVDEDYASTPHVWALWHP